ncbi:hypothetical protein HZS_4756 [Henneguya salminicola]|nr:hypothetical protein HZS_4756 [Henneguya salminicola]
MKTIITEDIDIYVFNSFSHIFTNNVEKDINFLYEYNYMEDGNIERILFSKSDRLSSEYILNQTYTKILINFLNRPDCPVGYIRNNNPNTSINNKDYSLANLYIRFLCNRCKQPSTDINCKLKDSNPPKYCVPNINKLNSTPGGFKPINSCKCTTNFIGKYCEINCSQIFESTNCNLTRGNFSFIKIHESVLIGNLNISGNIKNYTFNGIYVL